MKFSGERSYRAAYRTITIAQERVLKINDFSQESVIQLLRDVLD